MSTNTNELCTRLNLLQEKSAGDFSITCNEKTVGIADKLLEYKCISRKHHKYLPNQNYEVDQRIPKCDYTRYSPAETSTINTPNIPISISLPREGSIISLLVSYLDIKLEVIKKVGKGRYENGNDLILANRGPIASFINVKLTMPRENT